MIKSGIGQPVARLEDPRFLMGRGRFVDDITLPDQGYGFVLRSPHAHARIRAIDTRAAKAAPGVLAVLTAADAEADGLGGLPPMVINAPSDGRPQAPRSVCQYSPKIVVFPTGKNLRSMPAWTK